MENQKNIDRLFQEKLEHFEQSPRPEVWSQIQERMTQKKKRRILPFWWFSGGVAAILIISLLLFTLSNNNGDDPVKFKIQKEPSITKIPQESIPVKKDSSKQPLAPIIKDRAIVSTKSNKKKDFNYKKENKNILRKDKFVFAENPERKDPTKVDDKKEEVVNEIKKGIKDKTDKKTPILNKPIDSLQKKKPFVKKDFMAALQKNDSTETIKNSKKKWSLSPVFALLNSNSFTNTSPITSDLNSNPIKGENTFSYGVKVAYQLDKKWSLQSGVYFQKSSFLTEDVTIVSSSTLPSNVQIINFNPSPASQIDLSSGSTFLLFLNASADINPNDVTSIINNSSIEQSFGYLEIPFEVKYQFLENKKLQTNIIFGFSSLFLTKNQINTVSQTSTVLLGEANNLNGVNFSGNFGFDIDYKIHQNLILNINPMFKGQLNTFSKNSNGFKPYQIGIYTGLKYQF